MLRLSRNNRTTIANTDMKRLNRRYASVKKKLNLKKIDRTPTTPDDSIEQMDLYHKAVLSKIIHKDFYKKLDQNAMARDFFLENHAVKHTVKRYVDHKSADLWTDLMDRRHGPVDFWTGKAKIYITLTFIVYETIQYCLKHFNIIKIL